MAHQHSREGLPPLTINTRDPYKDARALGLGPGTLETIYETPLPGHPDHVKDFTTEAQ